MAIRNFYIKASIDGRKTRLTGGPARKDGGFDLTITIRHEGSILQALDIIGHCNPDGTLTLTSMYGKDFMPGDPALPNKISVTTVR